RSGEADDLSQETFLRAYRAWESLNEDANVRAWLFAIATNLARNYFRSENRRRRAYAGISERRSDVDPASPEEARRFHETRTLIEAVVDGPPPKQHLALLVRQLHHPASAATSRAPHGPPRRARAPVVRALR